MNNYKELAIQFLDDMVMGTAVWEWLADNGSFDLANEDHVEQLDALADNVAVYLGKARDHLVVQR